MHEAHEPLRNRARRIIPKDDIYRRSRRLICFDMDSTLIETEVIDELAERAGVGDQVREITAKRHAWRNRLPRKLHPPRRAPQKGLDESVMEEIAHNLPITEGLERMMTILKRVGYKTAILSGGSPLRKTISARNTASTTYTQNELEIENGKLTGRYVGKSSTDDARRNLRLLCQFESINIEQSVAVGDGANALPMLNLAGLGIAFHAKPKVKATARQAISTIGLDGISTSSV